jgi:steroid Delta-isomerase
VDGQNGPMPLTPGEIRTRADAYVATINSRDPDLIVQVFAPEATFEDPVGSPVHLGRGEIKEVFERAATTLQAMRLTRVSPISVATCHAAFALLAVIELNGATSEIDVVDVLTFDDAGLVSSVRAFWNFEDVRAR